ncbi:XRE family transcriptional regulator [Helicobacter enhydrae]|uniref:XRE family transcriptional regulator n=1 Tax=Helicobacter enhydrae TaxID=222136 RepID=UPI001F47E414|nr:LexA family transcriptional regulator [Helicobacter enhydrae]
MLNKKIFAIREKSHLSQKEFAEMTGISYGTFQKYEYGEQSPRFEYLQKISQIFQIPMSYFLDDEFVSQTKTSSLVPQNECVSECVSPSSDPNSYYNIPKLTLHAQAGGGNELLDLCCYESGETLTIDKAFFKSIPQHKLKAIKVEGYSMIPMLYPDSWVIFEESREFKGDGLYIINYANQLMVKLLQLDPARNILDIISANKDYKSYSISESQIEFIVIGKVLRCII